MKIFDIFKSKKIETLEEKIDDLQEKLKATSDLSKSLLGFADGKTYYFNKAKENSYADHYTIYRGIDMLASLGASLPSNIYRGDKLVPKEQNLSGGFNLYSPNPFMSLNELNYIALVYFFYRGEYMIEVREDPFLYLIPINPKRMTRIDGTLDWKYNNGSERRTISGDNLIYITLFNPDAGDIISGRGLSPVDVVKADLMNEESAIAYNTQFFKNFGQIGGFFYDKDSKARTEDMDLIVKQFESTKTGTRNAYKTLGLPRGIRYEQLQQTMREMEYLESRKDIRDRILAILGIHKSLFGVTDQVNRSVSEEATRMLWLHNLKPRMKRIEQAWERQFFKKRFPQFTYKYDFSYIAELKQSVEIIEKQAKLLKFLGYTTNEINEKLKLEMEEINDPVLDMRTIPSNLIPFSEFEDTPNTNATASLTEPNKLLAEYFPDDEAKEITANSPYTKLKYSRSMNRIKRKSERKMVSKLGSFFAKELGDIIGIILGEQEAASSLNSTTTLAHILNKINQNKANLMLIVKPLYEEASLDADKLARRAIQDTNEPIIAQEIVDKLTNEITHISNYTYKLIRNQIKAGVDAGETIEQIASRVRNVYKFNKSRARMIAKTESLKAIEMTTDKRYRESNVEFKQWINTGGPNSRDEHNANAAQGPIPYDQPFQNGQMTPGDGDASQVISCRCTLVPFIK